MPAPQKLDRAGLGAAIGCYLIWGLFPVLFHSMGQMGASAWEIVGWRTVFAVPVALAAVIVMGRLPAVRQALVQPRMLATLTLSAVLIATNWTVYVWAVSNGQTLSASLGYYINPLVNAAVGAFFFREHISRAGKAALALATIGVVVQAVSLGAPPWIALILAASFASYGIVRKQVQVDAQTGLLVECVILAPLAVAGLFWLGGHGGVAIGRTWNMSLLLLLCGPATVAPLTLFAMAARRLPLNVVGFLQFITPTLQFIYGLTLGERLTPLSLVAFGFIWAGAAIFTADLVGRLVRENAAETAAVAS